MKAPRENVSTYIPGELAKRVDELASTHHPALSRAQMIEYLIGLGITVEKKARVATRRITEVTCDDRDRA